MNLVTSAITADVLKINPDLSDFTSSTAPTG